MINNAKHYRVVRYANQPLGRQRQVIRQHISFDIAKMLKRSEDIGLPHTQIVIEDENT